MLTEGNPSRFDTVRFRATGNSAGMLQAIVLSFTKVADTVPIPPSAQANELMFRNPAPDTTAIDACMAGTTDTDTFVGGPVTL
jgi:hypothetical protein